jgi:hypothetical protein
MPRAIHPETEAVNADSFLDIVASIVSIMIIMVVLTGLKIKNTPVDASISGQIVQATAALKQDAAAEQAIMGEVHQTTAQIEDLQREAMLRERQRNLLALAVSTLEQRLQGGTRQVGERKQRDAGLETALADARAQFDQLNRQRVAVESSDGPAVQVECYPTPISRPVDGREIDFQLRNGRLAFVPLEPLRAEFLRDASEKKDRLMDLPEFANTVGPIGGFRLRYTIERRKLVPGVGASGNLKAFTLIPVSDDMGEPWQAALADSSEFRRVLAGHEPKYTLVTVWIYPESFEAFRQIKKELWRLGYAVAARPLPEGVPIGFSPHGTKSLAE